MSLRHKSWKTTVVSITAMVVAIGTMVVEPLLDDDPATKPDWKTATSLVIAAAVGLWSRDDDKTSEDVGADGKKTL
jgi:hypothetical protein